MPFFTLTKKRVARLSDAKSPKNLATLTEAELRLYAQARRPKISAGNVSRTEYQVADEWRDVAHGKRYRIITYGCQMNEHDTEALAGLLKAMGYEETAVNEEADLILFNTCAVRENPENKVFGEIGRLRPLKRRNPELLLGLCGCMAQEKVVQAKVQTTYPWIDLVFGTHNIHRLPDLVMQAVHSQETVLEVWDKSDTIYEHMPKVRKAGVRAWVNIQYGCNKFCTYCVVPHTRGRERSRSKASIVEEVRELVEEGFAEVTLLGQNVNDYGLDLSDVDFADLLYAVGRVDGIKRVRFTTSNPWNFTDRLIAAIAETDTVCEHIHLPVQAGSNRVLAKMNRGYTREYYLQLVARIRAAIPNVALTTDLIVGFPTETEADFLKTLSLVRDLEYDSAYTFIYSPRTGTPAAKLLDPLEEAVKKERLNRLVEVQNVISRRISDRYLGSVERVLVEGTSKTNDRLLSGRTRSNKIVLVEGAKAWIGEEFPVRITDGNTWTLRGERLPVSGAQESDGV